MPPKILYFDLGKVLLDFSHEQMCRQMADVAGVSWESVHRAVFDDADCQAALIRFETGHISTDEFFDHICAATDTAPDRRQFAEAACDIFTPIAPMLALVERLAAAGNRLAVLSNTNPVQWDFIADGRYPLLALGRPDCAFERAILSYEIGAMKPDAAIYRAAAEQAGVAREEMFFTDDRLENIEGAAAVGIDAVHFAGCAGLVEQLRSRGVPGA